MLRESSESLFNPSNEPKLPSHSDINALVLEASRARDRYLAQSLGRGLRAAGRGILSLSRRAVQWRRRHDLYVELMSLDDRTLQDIGLSRSEIGSVVVNGALPGNRAANVNRPRAA